MFLRQVKLLYIVEDQPLCKQRYKTELPVCTLALDPICDAPDRRVVSVGGTSCLLFGGPLQRPSTEACLFQTYPLFLSVQVPPFKCILSLNNSRGAAAPSHNDDASLLGSNANEGTGDPESCPRKEAKLLAVMSLPKTAFV